MSTTEHDVVVIVGPTAGGKTALSVALAKALPGGGECVNADSMQVYRGMDIGTAKPSAEERKGVPHHLMDIVDPDTPFTLDDWLAQATDVIADIRSRGKWPILVGGTNLYVQAFYWGLIDAPGPDPALRATLDALPPEDLRARLEAADPQAAQRIHPNDRRRTIRALEVAASGASISSMQGQWTQPHRSDARLVGLQWPTEVINARINARVKQMAQAGLEAEVRRLAPTLGPQAAEALGYKQLLPVLAGQCSLDDALEQVKIGSRRLAKQQRTWLRRFGVINPALWIEPAQKDPELLVQQAFTWILGESASDKKA